MSRPRDTVYWMLASSIVIGLWGSAELFARNRWIGLLIVLASPFIGLLLARAWHRLGGPEEATVDSGGKTVERPPTSNKMPRVVFVLALVLGVPLLWLAEQYKWIHDRHATIERENAVAIIANIGTKREAPWPIRMLGEPGVNEVVFGPAFGTDYELKDMQRKQQDFEALFPEAEISGERYFSR